MTSSALLKFGFLWRTPQAKSVLGYKASMVYWPEDKCQEALWTHLRRHSKSRKLGTP